MTAVTTNGQHPPDPTEAPVSLESLRTTPGNVHGFRGYGPLVVGAILFLLMVTLAPTVAPEQVVERPVDSTETAP